MRLVLPVIALAISAAGSAFADESWPALFRDAVGPYQGEETPHSFDMSVTRGSGDVLFRYSYDPSSATPVTIHEQTDQISEADLLESVSDDAGDIWCDGMEDRVRGDVELAAESDTTATFTFTPTTPEDAEDFERQIAERSIGTVVVDKETRQLVSFQYHLPESFKPMIIARVHTFDMFGTCEAGPSGRPYLSELTMAFDVSAMGQRQSESSIQRVENVEVVR